MSNESSCPAVWGEVLKTSTSRQNTTAEHLAIQQFTDVAPRDARVDKLGNINERLLVPFGNKRSNLLRRSWRRRPDLNRGWRFCKPRLVSRTSGSQHNLVVVDGD